MLLKYCFTSTETVGLLGTGAQDVHLDFHTVPTEAFRFNKAVCLVVCVSMCVYWGGGLLF